MKKLKQKIAVGLVCASGLGALLGLSFVVASASQKGNAVRDFQNSTEYGQIIGHELAEAEAIFDSQEFSLESLKAYYEAVDKAYSLDHAEELTIADKGKYGKAYADAEAINTAGILTLAASGGALITACACCTEIVTGKKKGEPIENSFDK